MKKTITLALLLTIGLLNAQAFKGDGDIKFDLGATIQEGGSGIRVSSDFGLGENMSFGFITSYLLSVSKDDLGKTPDFGDRIDVKGRFNANLGNVFQLDPKMDIYPGLDLGLRNFGAHLGFRYFFTEGFGIFTEAGIPIASYKTSPVGFDKLNNQFVFNIGASFNL
ncbi:hypothetical protein SAMN05444396_103226 [Flavobacterium segetis]|uniref:Outer membrane protein beta-barrel domain-containing protein n=1 Tax=Flavobacterium segetis TaxID=271157 RepID=A0A1M5G3B6_9FLAO|nr:DUF6646 family protein [Flavobacterium segetis]SHF97922.1 hypothetical protein SAMN05444396_103226 [Flavobacterium segetis]